jgi:antitoxin VapB
MGRWVERSTHPAHAVTEALRERLDRERARGTGDLTRQLRRLADEVRGLPVLDDRTADSILGYDERGLPR